MKKKFTLGTVIALVLITAILTFQVTFVLATGYAADKYSSGGSSESSSFINNVIKKLTTLDSTFRELYIGEIDDEALLESVLKGYIAGTGDAYSAYFTADEFSTFMSDLNGETEGIGVSVIYNTELNCIEIISVMPDSPALEAGLAPGDLIIYVGEEKKSVAELGYDAAINKLRGKTGTEAVFYVYHGVEDTEPEEYRIKRTKVTSISVMSHVCELDSSVGIVKITGFDGSTYEQFTNALDTLTASGCNKFIFDLRYNPGGELNSVVNTLDYLLPEGPVIRVYDADDNLVEERSSGPESFDYPMAVLVNGQTASAAELFTSALMDYDKATVVGETTYGKGSMQTTLSLPDGSALKVTYRMYKPPYSEGYDGVGIKPDVEVALDEALKNKNIYKITDEEDNQLKAALSSLTDK